MNDPTCNHIAINTFAPTGKLSRLQNYHGEHDFLIF